MNIDHTIMIKLLKNYNNNFDIKYIKPLYILGTLFGLTPYYNFKRQFNNVSIVYFIPQIMSGIYILFSYLHFLDGSIEVVFKGSRLTEVIVDSVLYVFITILNLVAVIKSSLMNHTKWKKMLQLFEKLDKQINCYKSSQQDASFFLKTLIESAIVLSILGYECWTFVRVFGFAKYKFYLFQRLQYYYIFITVLLMCHFSLSLKYRYTFFNDLLEFIFQKKQYRSKLNKAISINSKVDMFTPITRMFLDLNRLVHTYNDVFGWEILILMGTVVMALLESLNFILLSGGSFIRKGELYKNEMMSLSILISLMILVSSK